MHIYEDDESITPFIIIFGSLSELINYISNENNIKELKREYPEDFYDIEINKNTYKLTVIEKEIVQLLEDDIKDDWDNIPYD